MERFYRPKTIGEVLDLRGRDGNVYLAGGTEVNRRPSRVKASGVISLAALSLSGIAKKEDGVHIGAMTTFRDALDSDLVPPWLKTALRFMASSTRRNMATVGGNVALLADDSYLVPTLVAGMGKIVFARKKEGICFPAYVTRASSFRGNLIREIVVPSEGRIVESRRFSRTAQSPAAATVSLGMDEKGGGARLCAAVKGSGVEVLSSTAQAISASADLSREDLHAALGAELAASDDYVTGSAAYKKYIVEEAVWEMLQKIREELT